MQDVKANARDIVESIDAPRRELQFSYCMANALRSKSRSLKCYQQLACALLPIMSEQRDAGSLQISQAIEATAAISKLQDSHTASASDLAS